MINKRVWIMGLAGGLFTIGSAPLRAVTLLIGHDTTTTTREYTTSGAFIQTWGTSNGVSGVARDEFGNVYSATPDFGNNVIEKVDSSNNPVSSFTATVNGNWIEDMGYLGGGTLLVSTYEGNVYSMDQAGNASFMFATGNRFIGVTYDGVNIWTTGGTTAGAVYKRDFAGNVLSSFAVPFVPGGIGYDFDGTLYIGAFQSGGAVHHYTTTGTSLGSWTTGDGLHIDGLEAGVVPEPASVVLVGIAGFFLARRRR